VNCPNCNNEVEVLERNYGALFTCPKCQAVYFVNFDGTAEFSTETYQAPVIESGQHTESAFQGIAQDISDFGNSEVQISALHYSLEVSGLDSKEDISEFQECISDSRFGWDVTELMKKINNGRITLEKLNPVQAFVLNKRIHFLELELKWKQHVLE